MNILSFTQKHGTNNILITLVLADDKDFYAKCTVLKSGSVNSSRTESFWRKFQKMHSPNMVEKLMVPSASAPQELSNEWS
jgi:ABC-type uncharacterized transport system ATPase subunit